MKSMHLINNLLLICHAGEKETCNLILSHLRSQPLHSTKLMQVNSAINYSSYFAKIMHLAAIIQLIIETDI